MTQYVRPSQFMTLPCAVGDLRLLSIVQSMVETQVLFSAKLLGGCTHACERIWGCLGHGHFHLKVSCHLAEDWIGD